MDEAFTKDAGPRLKVLYFLRRMTPAYSQSLRIGSKWNNLDPTGIVPAEIGTNVLFRADGTIGGERYSYLGIMNGYIEVDEDVVILQRNWSELYDS